MNLARLVLAVAAFVLSCFTATAQAQTPMRMLSGAPPGGDVDAVARVIAEKLAEAIGRQVVVDSRTGAAGSIALMALKAAAPDGNTVMLAVDTVLTLYPHTVKKPGYDPLRDFAPIAHVCSFQWALGVGANVPAKDLAEWLNWVKLDNKNGAFGSTGVGTGSHFLGLMLAQATGLPLVNVPFRGVAPALTDLVAGQIPSAILTLGGLARQARAGKVRILAHAGSQRSSVAPEVPSFKELGYPAVEVSTWFGLIGPAGLRPEVVARYNDIINQAQRVQAVRDRLRALDLEPREMAPVEVAAKIKAGYDRWGPVVKASGFGADSQ